MKKSIILFMLLVILFACKKKSEPEPAATPPPPSTTGTGNVKFTSAPGSGNCPGPGGLTYLGILYENIGFAYNSTDLANQAYFLTHQFSGTYTFSNISAGTYYYHQFTSRGTSDPCYPTFVSQSSNAAITVIAGQTININIP